MGFYCEGVDSHRRSGTHAWLYSVECAADGEDLSAEDPFKAGPLDAFSHDGDTEPRQLRWESGPSCVCVCVSERGSEGGTGGTGTRGC